MAQQVDGAMSVVVVDQSGALLLTGGKIKVTIVASAAANATAGTPAGAGAAIIVGATGQPVLSGTSLKMAG